MKVLFLDIDGVLVTRRSYDQEGYLHGRNNEFDWTCSDLLEAFLISHNDVNIVLSSTWRKLANWPGRIRKESPLIHSRIIGVTLSLNGHRGEEIQDWINMYGVDSYVILDDDSDMLDSQMERFIKINREVGLTGADVSLMSEMFRR